MLALTVGVGAVIAWPFRGPIIRSALDVANEGGAAYHGAAAALFDQFDKDDHLLNLEPVRLYEADGDISLPFTANNGPINLYFGTLAQGSERAGDAFSTMQILTDHYGKHTPENLQIAAYLYQQNDLMAMRERIERHWLDQDYSSEEAVAFANYLADNLLIENGQPVAHPEERLRLNLFTYSYGGVFSQEVQSALATRMQEMGYSDEQIKESFSQVLVISHASPANPTPATFSFQRVALLAPNDWRVKIEGNLIEDVQEKGTGNYITGLQDVVIVTSPNEEDNGILPSHWVDFSRVDEIAGFNQGIGKLLTADHLPNIVDSLRDAGMQLGEASLDSLEVQATSTDVEERKTTSSFTQKIAIARNTPNHHAAKGQPGYCQKPQGYRPPSQNQGRW